MYSFFRQIEKSVFDCLHRKSLAFAGSLFDIILLPLLNVPPHGEMVFEIQNFVLEFFGWRSNP